MPPLPPEWPLLLGGAVLAGLVQGLSGFGFGLVAAVFWAGPLPPQVVAPLIVLCSAVGQALSVRTVLPSLDLRLALSMVAGGLAGVPLGVAALALVDAAAFRAGVGLMLVAYCPAMLLAGRLPQVTAGGRWADAAAGLAGGIMGGIGGLSGPAPTLWCALRGWNRDTQRAVFQTFLVAVQAATLAGYLASGTFTPDVMRSAAWVVPAMVLPSLLGARLYAAMSPGLFRHMVLVLLLLTGLALVAQSGPAVLGRLASG